MKKNFKNRYAPLTKGQKITAHTVILSTDAENPEMGRFVKASFWVADAIAAAIFSNPVRVPDLEEDTVHLRHHVTRAEFDVPTEYRYQLPSRAESDRSKAARAMGRTVGQGHFSGSMIQFTAGGELINEPAWVTLGEIFALRQKSDHGFSYSIQGLTWTAKERETLTAYLQRYYGIDA